MRIAALILMSPSKRSKTNEVKTDISRARADSGPKGSAFAYFATFRLERMNYRFQPKN